MIAMGAVFFFGFGEEISWGQRIFGWKSNDWFLRANSQGETNIHNLVLGDFRVNKNIFGTALGICVAIYFLILPLLYRKVERVKKLINSFAIPLPKLYHIAIYLVIVGLTELIAGGKKGEVLEFGGCWMVVMIFLFPYNRGIFSRTSIDR